jgi:hypothetical protein
MTSSFVLTLDTVTHVAAQINHGAETTESSNVTFELELDADAAEIKVWGSIDPDSPLNTGLAETEGEASWMPATSSLLVALEAGQGPRVLHVRVRDDVLNEATASASIFVGESVTPPPPPPAAPIPGGAPEPFPAAPPRTVESRSRLVLSSSASAAVQAGGESAITSSSTARVRAATAGRSRAVLAGDGAARVRVGAGAATRTSTTYVLTKGSGPEMEAIVASLL